MNLFWWHWICPTCPNRSHVNMDVTSYCKTVTNTSKLLAEMPGPGPTDPPVNSWKAAANTDLDHGSGEASLQTHVSAPQWWFGGFLEVDKAPHYVYTHWQWASSADLRDLEPKRPPGTEILASDHGYGVVCQGWSEPSVCGTDLPHCRCSITLS